MLCLSIVLTPFRRADDEVRKRGVRAICCANGNRLVHQLVQVVHSGRLGAGALIGGGDGGGGGGAVVGGAGSPLQMYVLLVDDMKVIRLQVCFF